MPVSRVPLPAFTLQGAALLYAEYVDVKDASMASSLLKAHLAAPPPGSAAARAQDFGVDIFAVARKLVATAPNERLTRLDTRIEDLRTLRSSRR